MILLSLSLSLVVVLSSISSIIVIIDIIIIIIISISSIAIIISGSIIISVILSIIVIIINIIVIIVIIIIVMSLLYYNYAIISNNIVIIVIIIIIVIVIIIIIIIVIIIIANLSTNCLWAWCPQSVIGWDLNMLIVVVSLVDRVFRESVFDVYRVSPWRKLPPFPRQYFQIHFLELKCMNFVKISLKFDPKGPINNIPALAQIMAWCLN